LFYISSGDGEVAIVWNLYLTLVDVVVGWFKRLIINFSGAFCAIVVFEHEETGGGDISGGDNKITSGGDGFCSIGLDNSIRTWESSVVLGFSSDSSSSSVSHWLSSL
jgi:hypothetical protein